MQTISRAFNTCSTMKLTKLYAALALAIAPLSAQALEDRAVTDASGRTVFIARFFDMGDGPFDERHNTSFWSWQGHEAYKNEIVDGLSYWAEILQIQGNNPPTIVNIGTSDEPGNAYGGS
ncbi:TPA: hypothetical protein MYN70_006065, partial [Klebsiella pneumoniae]|nr:hypothetical protein [Klebsiella pneumoniae]